MTNSGDKFKESYIFATLFTAALFGTYLYLNWTSILETNIKGTDYSLIALQSFRAKSFEVLVGPYSRFSFNHPGPIQFYLYALAEYLPVSYSAAHAFAQLLINAASFWLCIRLAAGLWGIQVASLVALSVGAMVDSNLGFLSDTWGPSAIYLPYLLYLVAAFGAGRVPGTIFCAFAAAAWVFSNHIGMLLPLVFTSLVVFWRMDKALFLQREFKGGVLLFLLCFALPVSELFINYPLNNFQRFVRFLDRYDPTVTISDVIQSAFFAAGGAAALSLSAIALLCLIFTRSTQHIGIIFGAAFAGHFISLSQTVGKLHPYLYWPCFSVLLLAAAICVGLSVPVNRRSSIWVLSILATVYLVYLGGVFQHDRGTIPAKYGQAMQVVRENSQSAFILKTKHHQNWESMTAVADTLAREGVPFCVQERMQFVFGSDLVCKDLVGHVPLWFGN